MIDLCFSKFLPKILPPSKNNLSILEYIKLSFLGRNKTSDAMGKIRKPKPKQNNIIKGAKPNRFGGIEVPAMDC